VCTRPGFIYSTAKQINKKQTNNNSNKKTTLSGNVGWFGRGKTWRQHIRPQ
jgi:hypothetical protein